MSGDYGVHVCSVGKDYKEMNLIVVMLGGGITVAAHKKGKMIDAPDGLEGREEIQQFIPRSK